MSRAGGDEAAAVTARPAVSEDRILGGRLLLQQPREGYRVAIDPVLLAAAVPAAGGERALDLGCGVGAAALCLARRIPGVTLDGLEREPLLVALARENAARNDLAAAFRPRQGDLRRPPAGLSPESYDHVLCNPPYLERGAATPSPKELRAAANLERDAGLADWVAAALRLARPGGSVTFIHRAERLDALLAALRGGAGAAVVFPLWPKGGEGLPGKPAKRVIVQAWKGRAGGCRLAPGLALHDADGRFSAAAEAVLRHAEALPL